MLTRFAKYFSLIALGSFLVVSSVSAAAQNISAADAQALLKRSSAASYLLDVRTLGEFMQKRIAGAHLIPIDQIQTRVAEIPKDRAIVVYCEVGARSEQVAGYLARLGYAQVYNMYGGIMAWQVRGYPILTGMP